MSSLKINNLRRFTAILKSGLIAILLFPLSSFAHGGVEKSIDDITIYLNQSPVSPLVGEKVSMNFVLSKPNFKRLQNQDVKLLLIDTYYGDQSKDKIILTQNEITDANGAFNFNYTFNKENYFDVELKFTDPETSKQEETGFLIQPREEKFSQKNTSIIFALIGLIGLFIGYGIPKLKIRKHA